MKPQYLSCSQPCRIWEGLVQDRLRDLDLPLWLSAAKKGCNIKNKTVESTSDQRNLSLDELCSQPGWWSPVCLTWDSQHWSPRQEDPGQLSVPAEPLAPWPGWLKELLFCYSLHYWWALSHCLVTSITVVHEKRNLQWQWKSKQKKPFTKDSLLFLVIISRAIGTVILN